VPESDPKPVQFRNKPDRESPSPHSKQRDEDEINEQLKEIQPRYPEKTQKNDSRPASTAQPAPASKARISSNNRDLTKVSVAQSNNFMSESGTQGR